MNLPAAVAALTYKPGWSFRLETGWTGTTGGAAIQTPASVATAAAATVQILAEPVRLVITAATIDSHTGVPVTIEHRFHAGSPPGPGDWRRWLLDRILDVERHEACEFFTLNGQHPFYPGHGPGAALYDIPGPARETERGREFSALRLPREFKTLK